MQKNLKFHNDPRHGWLEVPLTDLDTLRIKGEISACSYQDQDNAYLEEDLDAGVYLRAARAAGWQVKTEDCYTNRDSFVRTLRSYGG